jgi:16S rRNA (adenine1518-N6/adenine1519-N6)-dimethyltransferase
MDPATPAGWLDPRTFLSRHKLRPKDSFGQCFLVSPHVVKAIVDAVDARPDETVVEIGTGTGTLARCLAPAARRVLAIERDRDLVAALAADPLPPNVTVVEADAATFDYGAVYAEGPTAVVGNLPYQITGRLIRALVETPGWRVAVVMVQQEVGRRLAASPGDDDWGALSVFTQAACSVDKVCSAAPGCFHPAPRVQSTVVRLTPRATPLAVEDRRFQQVVKALFAARRKTLRNGLSSVVGRDHAAAVCAAAGVDPGARPETLTIEQLGRLSEATKAAPAGA